MQSGYGTDSRYKYSLGEHSVNELKQKETKKEDKHSESLNQSGRSRSSPGDRGSQSGTSRSRINSSDYKLCEEVLNEDFELMFALSPSADETFCPKSVDHKLATLWHNKLRNLQCESIKDLRMRQDYMSNFSACLNQRELRGVFQHDPPEILTWVDFHEMIDPNPGSMSLGNESVLFAMASMMQHQGINQSTKAGQSTSNYRHVGGFNRRKNIQGTTHKLASKSKPKFVPKNLSSPLSSSVPSTCDSKNYWTFSSSSFGRKSSSQNRCRPPIDDEVRKDMNYLMETIGRELRGEQLPETDKYLEPELKRYREFYARHRSNNSDLKSTAAAVEPSNDRIQMLLNMQNDLIKVLSE